MHLDLRVDLKTGDLVRQTALMTLEETLGWQGIVLGIGRSDLWRFEGEGERFREAVEKEVARTGIFVNETKHRARFQDGAELGRGEALDPEGALAPGELGDGPVWRALLLVSEEGGEKPALRRRVEQRLGGARLDSLQGVVLWEIRLRAPDADSARRAVTGLALSRSRERGLLLNPHFQEGRLLRLEPAGEEKP